MGRIKILLVDDHPVVRAGFNYFLRGKTDFDVSEAESAEDAYEQYCEESPDLVIMDIFMPGIGGIEGIRKLLAFNQEAKIIVLSIRDDPNSVFRAMSLGVSGYLSKNCDPSELIEAIQEVMAGKDYIGSGLQIDDGHSGKPHAGLANLTKREFEVFQLLALGKSVLVIAETLNRSAKTIHNHRSSILGKLAVKNTAQLSVIAAQSGMLPI